MLGERGYRRGWQCVRRLREIERIGDRKILREDRQDSGPVIGRSSAWDLAVTLIDRRSVDLPCSFSIKRISANKAHKELGNYYTSMFGRKCIVVAAFVCIAASEGVSFIRDRDFNFNFNFKFNPLNFVSKYHKSEYQIDGTKIG